MDKKTLKAVYSLYRRIADAERRQLSKNKSEAEAYASIAIVLRWQFSKFSPELQHAAALAYFRSTDLNTYRAYGWLWSWAACAASEFENERDWWLAYFERFTANKRRFMAWSPEWMAERGLMTREQALKAVVHE